MRYDIQAMPVAGWGYFHCWKGLLHAEGNSFAGGASDRKQAFGCGSWRWPEIPRGNTHFFLTNWSDTCHWARHNLRRRRRKRAGGPPRSEMQERCCRLAPEHQHEAGWNEFCYRPKSAKRGSIKPKSMQSYWSTWLRPFGSWGGTVAEWKHER